MRKENFYETAEDPSRAARADGSYQTATAGSLQQRCKKFIEQRQLRSKKKYSTSTSKFFDEDFWEDFEEKIERKLTPSEKSELKLYWRRQPRK